MRYSVVLQRILQRLKSSPAFRWGLLLAVVIVSVLVSKRLQAPAQPLPRGENVARVGLWNEMASIASKYPGAPVSGGIFLYRKQTSMLAHLIDMLASQQSLKDKSRRFRVCETGFAAGHSAALWLASHNNVDVVVFDLFDRPYQTEILHLLDQLFPGRVEHVVGDNCETLPEFIARGAAPCDFVHASSLCQHDVRNLGRMSKCGALVTASAMDSVGSGLYFGAGGEGEWAQGCVEERLKGVQCFRDAEFELEKDFVFGARGHTAAHEFCIGVATGECRAGEVPGGGAARAETRVSGAVKLVGAAAAAYGAPRVEVKGRVPGEVRDSGCLADQ